MNFENRIFNIIAPVLFSLLTQFNPQNDLFLTTIALGLDVLDRRIKPTDQTKKPMISRGN